MKREAMGLYENLGRDFKEFQEIYRESVLPDLLTGFCALPNFCRYPKKK
jgi:hypothetical protein